MTKSKLTPEGACTKCGSPKMQLAVDQTRYTAYECVDGVWMDSGSNTEENGSNRVASKLGKTAEVPEGLL